VLKVLVYLLIPNTKTTHLRVWLMGVYCLAISIAIHAFTGNMPAVTRIRADLPDPTGLVDSAGTKIEMKPLSRDYFLDGAGHDEYRSRFYAVALAIHGGAQGVRVDKFGSQLGLYAARDYRKKGEPVIGFGGTLNKRRLFKKKNGQVNLSKGWSQKTSARVRENALDLGDGYWVDSTAGNEAKFLNHYQGIRLKPNVQFSALQVLCTKNGMEMGSIFVPFIETMEEIACGVQLVANYQDGTAP